MNNSRLFYRLLNFQMYNEYTVNELYFFISGYEQKGVFDNCVEEWISEFLQFINMKVSKMYLNLDKASSQGFASIITEYQKSNEDGLKLFYSIFYNFCELKIPNFRSDLDSYHARATRRLPMDS